MSTCQQKFSLQKHVEAKYDAVLLFPSIVGVKILLESVPRIRSQCLPDSSLACSASGGRQTIRHGHFFNKIGWVLQPIKVIIGFQFC